MATNHSLAGHRLIADRSINSSRLKSNSLQALASSPLGGPSQNSSDTKSIGGNSTAAAAAASNAAGKSSSNGAGGQPGAIYSKGHQRRQSVARLLPDISKLRLLSWLVEASSELINCDIAIMDGVYAKLNKSQESLLFWSAGAGQHQQRPAVAQAAAAAAAAASPSAATPAPPPRPSKQPVANNSLAKMISKQQQQKGSNQLRASQKQKQQQQQLDQKSAGGGSSSRNHHSLPLTNYDASSLAAVSLSPSLGQHSTSQSLSLSLSLGGGGASAAAAAAAVIKSCDLSQRDGNTPTLAQATHAAAAEHHQFISCDGSQGGGGGGGNLSEDDDNDDANSSASSAGGASTASSSGVHGSLSSSCSFSTSSSASSTNGDCGAITGRPAGPASAPPAAAGQAAPENHLSSAERLSEKIRRTVMEHNYLQNLLVNIIRQHDRLRDALNHQRRRQLSVDHHLTGHHLMGRHSALSHGHGHSHSLGQGRGFLTSAGGQLPRIDLADIADALDDGCSCACHSLRVAANEPPPPPTPPGGAMVVDEPPARPKAAGKRASTLPLSLLTGGGSGASAASGSTPLVPLARKVRRLKKQRDLAADAGSSTISSSYSNNNNNNSEQLNKQDILSLLADKLCENCYETHYWLHGCSIDLMTATAAASGSRHQQQQQPQAALSADEQQQQLELNNAIVAKRNATFIKLVQQEVRSTISKSIELIDLIRKEIKSPESIKHKQLMRCFSTSIQLLTSVGNYVVPSQDISAFIPEAGQQQTQLFSLPSSDFDHLLMSGSYSLAAFSQLSSLNHQHQQQQQQSCNNGGASHQPQQSNYHLAPVPEIPIRRQINLHPRFLNSNRNEFNQSSSSTVGGAKAHTTASNNDGITNEHQALGSNRDKQLRTTITTNSAKNSGNAATTTTTTTTTTVSNDSNQVMSSDNCQEQAAPVESSSGASSNNSSASSSIARGTVQQSSLTRAQTSSAILDSRSKTSHDLSLEQIANLSRHHTEDDLILPSRPKFWQSSKFNFIKKLLHVKQQRLLRQQSKDRRIYNNKVQNKFRLVMMDLTHFNKSQQLLTTENGVNSLLASMRNVLEFGLYLTLKLY